MSDSTTLLIVGISASCAIGFLIYIWLRERGRNMALQEQLKSALQNDNIDLAKKIADGSAHPLVAWRLGAGLSAETFADALRVSVQDLKAAEAGSDHEIDPTSIAALIAVSSTPARVSHKPVGAPIMGSADAPSAASTEGTASGGSVSDGGGSVGGAM